MVSPVAGSTDWVGSAAGRLDPLAADEVPSVSVIVGDLLWTHPEAYPRHRLRALTSAERGQRLEGVAKGSRQAREWPVAPEAIPEHPHGNLLHLRGE